MHECPATLIHAPACGPGDAIATGACAAERGRWRARGRERVRRWRPLVSALLVCATSVLCHQARAQAIALTDERGVQVRFAQVPQRIVSLLPSLTETVCALDQCARLVGVDRYSNWPQQVQALPRLGGGLDPQVEPIVALRPDVVLLATSSLRVAARLESLGLRVVAMEPHDQAGIRRAYLGLGRLLGVADAAGRWQQMDAEVDAAARSVAASGTHPRVYFEVGNGPYAASAGSFIGEILARLGARNVVPAELGAFPKLNPEYVVRADPDLILVAREDAAALVQRAGWPALRAVRAQHLCLWAPDQMDVITRPGPRLAQAAQLLAQCLREKAP